jgi:hypothetical protein
MSPNFRFGYPFILSKECGTRRNQLHWSNVYKGEKELTITDNHGFVIGASPIVNSKSNGTMPNIREKSRLFRIINTLVMKRMWRHLLR